MSASQSAVSAVETCVGVIHPLRMMSRAGFTLAVMAFIALISALPEMPLISLNSHVNWTRIGTDTVFNGRRASSEHHREVEAEIRNHNSPCWGFRLPFMTEFSVIDRSAIEDAVVATEALVGARVASPTLPSLAYLCTSKNYLNLIW